MNFDHRRPDAGRHLDLARVGGNEERHPDAGIDQLRHHGGEHIVRSDRVEAAFGRYFLAPLRHQAGRVRPRSQRQGGHLLGRRHLEIERLGDLRPQARDVVVANVAAILAQMRRDAVGPRRDGDLGGVDRVRMGAAAGVAQGGDVIDIDAQSEVRDGRQVIDPFGNAVGHADLQASTRSAFATTCLARNCAMIEVRCLRS